MDMELMMAHWKREAGSGASAISVTATMSDTKGGRTRLV